MIKFHFCYYIYVKNHNKYLLIKTIITYLIIQYKKIIININSYLSNFIHKYLLINYIKSTNTPTIHIWFIEPLYPFFFFPSFEQLLLCQFGLFNWHCSYSALVSTSLLLLLSFFFFFFFFLCFFFRRNIILSTLYIYIYIYKAVN